MSNESLYTRRAPSFSAKLFELAPDGFKAFGDFNKHALAEGTLNVRTKELIAVAVAHITGCPYCIEAHVGKSKAQQVTFAEIQEAILVAAAVSAHATFYHAVNALKAFEDSSTANIDLYPRSNLALIDELQPVNTEATESFKEYVRQALKPGNLTEKEKLLIAVGSALSKGDAYSIDIFTAQAKSLGVTLTEISETLLVAAVLNAGAVVAHRVNAIAAFDLA